MSGRIDTDAALWDQATFRGRFNHFAWMANPLNGLVSNTELESAKSLLLAYKAGTEPPGTTDQQVERAMQLYKSAFHPDTGELQNVFGRMSFQMPGGMMITGAMMQFYKSVPAVVFWQWFNQSFNALVNYTNRNADSPTTTTQLGVAYTSATFSALGTAIGLKKVFEKSSNKLLQRFVPFGAVASANFVNIPLMRQNELMNGIAIFDADGQKAGMSTHAAKIGITQVVLSRVAMASPGMLVLPIIMQRLEQVPWFKARPRLHGPVQVSGVGCFLLLMVPMACALFPQDAQISLKDLKSYDPEVYSSISAKYGASVPQMFFYNKGL